MGDYDPVYVDAIDYSWASGWSFERNENLATDVSISNSDIYSFTITHAIQDFPTAVIKSSSFKGIKFSNAIKSVYDNLTVMLLLFNGSIFILDSLINLIKTLPNENTSNNYFGIGLISIVWNDCIFI